MNTILVTKFNKDYTRFAVVEVESYEAVLESLSDVCLILTADEERCLEDYFTMDYPCGSTIGVIENFEGELVQVSNEVLEEAVVEVENRIANDRFSNTKELSGLLAA